MIISSAVQELNALRNTPQNHLMTVFMKRLGLFYGTVSSATGGRANRCTSQSINSQSVIRVIRCHIVND